MRKDSLPTSSTREETSVTDTVIFDPAGQKLSRRLTIEDARARLRHLYPTGEARKPPSFLYMKNG